MKKMRRKTKGRKDFTGTCEFSISPSFLLSLFLSPYLYSLSLSLSREENLLRMNTSVKLNELIVEKSHDASLVIVNLPAPPSNPGKEENCILSYMYTLVLPLFCTLTHITPRVHEHHVLLIILLVKAFSSR